MPMRRMKAVAAVAAWAAVGSWMVAWGGCAQPERKEEKKAHTVRVRAPFTHVDVEVPVDDEDEATHVEVDVDD